MARRVRQFRHGAELRLLHRHFEIDIHRPFGRGLRDLRSAHERFYRGPSRTRLVIPLGKVTDETALIGAGVYPVYPRAALRGVPRPGRAQYQYRRTVAPRVVNRHGGTHQADIGMQAAGHHFVGDLGVAVCNRHRGFFMHAQHHLRCAVAEQVDDAIVQAAIACARHQRDIRHTQFAQHQGDGVAAPEGFAGTAGYRLVMHNQVRRGVRRGV